MDTISADCDPQAAARITTVLAELGGAAGGARFGTLRDDRVTYWRPAPTQASGTTGPLAAGSEPAHPTALGQVLLAHADESVRNRVLTREMGASVGGEPGGRDRLRSALSVARLSGVAVARDSATGAALRVAVPVLAADGRLVAGLEVAARNFDQVESVLPGLMAASRRVLRQA